MASHLTVTSGTSIGIGNPRALNGQTNAADNDIDAPNAFAAMLGLVGASTDAKAQTTATSSLTGDLVAGLALDADADGADRHASENPDALAAALNVMLPFDANAVAGDAKPLMDNLLQTLTELKSKLDAGEPLNDEFLAELSTQLDALGDALGLDLSGLGGLEQLATGATAPLPDDASSTDQLSAALAPLAEKLIKGQAEGKPETAALTQAIGEKLAALAAAMGEGEISADQLAELGLAADAQLDVDMEAAIPKLLVAAPTLDTETAAPILAKPSLQLSETVLTGKAEATPDAGQATLASAMTPADASSDTLQNGGDTNDQQPGDNKPEAKLDNGKPAEAKPAIGTTADIKPEPQNVPQPQTQSARVDAVAAPRVVQTGYQTSQQQLNLPQIAFELARQTTEGNTRFQIRLDPAELGRIDVQLDIDPSGQVNARLVVEKSETLDLMQRDQRGLEKALHQAGLDSAKTNLEFSLKQNNGGDTQQQGRNGFFGNSQAGKDASEVVELPPTINLYRASLSASGVNIIA